MQKLITIVLPAYNEEDNISRLVYEICKTTDKLTDYAFEYIFVDNNSTDATRTEMLKVCSKDDRWKYIRLSRNFTAEMSISAGFKVSRGEAVILLFTDLQDPPSLIEQFLLKWEDGYEVVCGFMEDRRSEGAVKHMGAKLAFSLLNKLSDVDLPVNVVDCRLMSRDAVDAFNRMSEKNRYFRGLAHWVGFKTTLVPYTRQKRENGKSKTNFFYLIDYVFRAITSFSIKPLRFFLYLGFAVLFFTAVYTIFVVVSYFMELAIPGFSTIIILLLMILSILSIGIGVLGEYVGRIYIETKERPLWVISEAINIEIDDSQKYGNC